MRLERWSVALALSLGLHLGVLTLPLSNPHPPHRVAPPEALEIVLLNARRSQAAVETPAKAQALAQTTWAGGGDAERGRARTVRPQQSSGRGPHALQTMTEQLRELEQQQEALLSQIKRMPTPVPAAAQQALAEIERRIQEENARPRKRYMGPSTREVVYAEYYDGLRRKIEAQGTRHFPTHQGKRLYGALTLILTVDVTGRMVSTEVAQGSGLPELDRRARAIANSAAPFGEFLPAMKRQVDQLAWVVRFTFSAEDGLQTQWFEPGREGR